MPECMQECFPQSVGHGRLSRRRYLAAGATAATVAFAGCSDVIDWVADRLLEDVNVFSEADESVSGTITVVGPDGERRLEESFTLAPPDTDDDSAPAADDEEGSTNLEAYADVWTDAGAYEVSVELDTPLDGERSASETVTIDDPEEELLVVLLGSEEVDPAIDFRVGESLSDTWPERDDD